MKNKIIALAVFVLGMNLLTTNITAQNNLPDPAISGTSYNFAIGLRGGETSGLTLKKLNGNGAGFEGIFGIWNQGFSATLLAEKHVKAWSAPGLRWYYGAGGHVSIATNNRYYKYGNRYDRYGDGNLGLGVDGILGLEYKIAGAPIALSLDVKPYVEVISGGFFYGSLDPGLGIKMTF